MFFDLGFIPGPNESRSQFFLRVRKTREYLKTLPPEKKCSYPFIHQTESKKAPFWIGGCTQIFEHAGVRMASIELNKRLKLPEVLAHECVHYRRLMFDEPQYEEILAFSTSNTWRNKWGALLEQGSKSLFFTMYAISLIGCLTNYGMLVLLPLMTLGFYARRLKKKLKKYETIKTTVPECLHKILIGFTDKEFELLNTSSINNIHSYFKKGTTIRHKMLCAFFDTINC